MSIPCSRMTFENGVTGWNYYVNGRATEPEEEMIDLRDLRRPRLDPRATLSQLP
jgi:hypothetical protein